MSVSYQMQYWPECLLQKFLPVRKQGCLGARPEFRGRIQRIISETSCCRTLPVIAMIHDDLRRESTQNAQPMRIPVSKFGTLLIPPSSNPCTSRNTANDSSLIASIARS